jgi:hypothetical protein
MAEAVIADRGLIVVDFFDLGCSQRVPWERRGEAVALLEQARLADRQFDAVVGGSSAERSPTATIPSGTGVAAAPRCRFRRHDDSGRPAGRPCRGGVLLRRERVTQDGRATRPAWRSTHPVDCGRDRRRHADGRVGPPDFDGGCGRSLQLGSVDVDLDPPDPDDR